MCSCNNIPVSPYNMADCCCPIILKNMKDMLKASTENKCEPIMPLGCMMPGMMMPCMMPMMPNCCMMPGMMMPNMMPGCGMQGMMPAMMPNMKPIKKQEMKPKEKDMMSGCMLMKGMPREGMSPHIKMKTVDLEDIQE